MGSRTPPKAFVALRNDWTVAETLLTGPHSCSWCTAPFSPAGPAPSTTRSNRSLVGRRYTRSRVAPGARRRPLHAGRVLRYRCAHVFTLDSEAAHAGLRFHAGFGRRTGRDHHERLHRPDASSPGLGGGCVRAAADADAEHRAGHATLAAEWEAWITENLLRGATHEEVADGLVDEGLTVERARAAVAAVVRSPIFRAAMPFARESRRLRTYARLDHARWEARPDPTSMPRLPWPGVEAFFEQHWAPGVPAIFSDVVTKWPAMERWSLDRLEARFGDAEVNVTTGRTSHGRDYDIDAAKLATRTTLRDYIARIRREPVSNDFYMIARNRNAEDALGGVLEDVVLPEGLFRPDLAGGAAFWLGPAGTVTPLHHDTSNIFFCQVVGRKRYRMIAPMEIAVLDGARAMYAAIDPDAPDLVRFPWWEHVIVRDFVVGPGDALFIPVGWWHHVLALDVSVSLAINGFLRANRYDWLVPARD
jgi:hypothetical protein